MKTFCQCCDVEIVGEVCKADVWHDGVTLDYCSWECVEHEEEKRQEATDYAEF